MNEWMDAESRVEHAYKLYEDGRWPEAAAELRAAIEINPHNAAWYYNLGITLEAMEDFHNAGQEFLKASDLQKDDVEILNALGVNMTRQGKYAEALETFTQIEKVNPRYESSYCNRIITYTEMGLHDQAELMFYLARQVKDHCPLCYYNIAASFVARKNYEQAMYCFKQTRKLDPDHPDINARIAETYWAMENREKAREYYQSQIIKQGCDDVDILLDYTDLLMEIGDRKYAWTILEKASGLEPHNPAVQYSRGEFEFMKGHYAAAEQAFRRTIREDEFYPCAHAKLAQTLLKRGHPISAARHMQKEIKRAGNDTQVLGELGRLLVEEGLNRHGRKVLSRFVKLDQSDPMAYHYLAVSCFKINEYKEGIKFCRKAINLDPDFAKGYYNLALAYMKIGRTWRARRIVARAMDIAGHDQSIQNLASLLGTKGMMTKVLKKVGIVK